MEIAYLDTSALVKRYHEEEFSDVVDEIFENYTIAISELSIVEFASALVRKSYEGSIKKKEINKILLKFHEDMVDFIIIRFDSSIVSKAVEFVLKYGLKTLDSLQLSFATKLKDYDPLFVSFDEKLIKCAKSEGFRVLEILLL